jgi:hypothetical protein
VVDRRRGQVIVIPVHALWARLPGRGESCALAELVQIALR